MTWWEIAIGFAVGQLLAALFLTGATMVLEEWMRKRGAKKLLKRLQGLQSEYKDTVAPGEGTRFGLGVEGDPLD